MDNLEALRAALRARIQQDFDAQSRRRLKKSLLDALDGMYGFELPPSLVNQEFDNVWKQLQEDMKRSNRTFADEATARRRRRPTIAASPSGACDLGLVLAELGEKADIKISDDEVSAAMVERARQFPGQEKTVWDYYRKNPQALAELRAPIFEEKVVDHILGQVKLTEQVVSKEALFADEEEETGPPGGGGEAKAKEAQAEDTKASPDQPAGPNH